MRAGARSGAGRLWAILALPLVISIATAAGLAAALLGDGWWHWLSWLLLAMPLAVIVTALVGGRNRDSSRDSRASRRSF